MTKTYYIYRFLLKLDTKILTMHIKSLPINVLNYIYINNYLNITTLLSRVIVKRCETSVLRGSEVSSLCRSRATYRKSQSHFSDLDWHRAERIGDLSADGLYFQEAIRRPCRREREKRGERGLAQRHSR